MQDLCLTMAVAQYPIDEVAMDGLHTLFVERCQYLYAWFDILLVIAGFS